MLLTVVHYNRVSRTFTDALAKQDIAYERFFITPTIFNNVLWNGVVDAGDVYLLAQHSFYDEVPVTFTPVAKASTCCTTSTPTRPWPPFAGSVRDTSTPFDVTTGSCR